MRSLRGTGAEGGVKPPLGITVLVSYFALDFVSVGRGTVDISVEMRFSAQLGLCRWVKFS